MLFNCRKSDEKGGAKRTVFRSHTAGNGRRPAKVVLWNFVFLRLLPPALKMSLDITTVICILKKYLGHSYPHRDILSLWSPQKSPKRKIQKSRFKNIISGVPHGTVTSSLRELIFGSPQGSPRSHSRYRDPRHTESQLFCYAVKLYFPAALVDACIFRKFLIRIFSSNSVCEIVKIILRSKTISL